MSWKKGSNKRRERTKNVIIVIAIVCTLVSSGIAAVFYTNYTATIRNKDETIKSLDAELYTLQIENQTALYQEMNASLNAQISILKNQNANYEAEISSLNSEIASLEKGLASNGDQNSSANVQIVALQQRVIDLENQVSGQNENITALIQLNLISSLANFNDSGVWLGQTSGTFTQVAKQAAYHSTILSVTGLNLVPGKPYFVTLDMVMHAQSNETATAYFEINGDTNKTHYDTSYLYGNARWSTAASFQYENDPRIFDNGQYEGSMGIIFAGVLEIDPIGSLRMALTYNAYDNLRTDLETGLYGWIFTYTTVTTVNRIDINSTMPITGTLAIYDIEP